MTNKQVKLLSIETYDTNIYEPVKYIYAMEVQTINVFRQFMASIGSFIGGPTNISGITQKIDDVKKRAIVKMKNKALKSKCYLIIGVRVQVSQISTQNDGMMVIQVSGTLMKKKGNNVNNGSSNKSSRNSSMSSMS
tara:strand:- start:1231 stop:1638 length:408 start_codon:yes stop_codon:yes gene_type:complete